MKVRITARQMVEYVQTVEMSEADFAEYIEATENDAGDDWFNDFAERFIRTDEICDAKPFEDVYAEKTR